MEFKGGVAPSVLGPALLLAVSASLWGMSWYPFRQLAAGGIDGLWAIVLTELAACGVCLLIFGSRLRNAPWWGPLLPIGLLGGICNTGYVMGTIHGEVLRVTLLLYLAPLWTVFLAHWLLHERISRGALAIVGLSMIGALVMLWPFGPASSPLGWPDAWGLVAGMAYAGYNVMVRRHLELSVAHKVISSTAGAVLVAVVWIALAGTPLAADQVSCWAGLLVLGTGALLVIIVVLMQRGLEQLPASRAIVILMLELVAAALSAWWLADEAPGMREMLGGLLIVGASVLSTRTGPNQL